MVNVKEFGIIKSKVLKTKTGLVSNISDQKFQYKPVVANAIHVEEDGHLWMLVNSRLRKWDRDSNIPVTVRFVPDDCQISLSGIGKLTSPETIPGQYQAMARNAKAVMKVKIYYAEYVPLPGNTGRTGPLGFTRQLVSGILENVTGRSNRRLLVFR